VGNRGPATLLDHGGGLSELIWESLVDAHWTRGDIAHATIWLEIGVPKAPAQHAVPFNAPRIGRGGRHVRRGAGVDESGTAWERLGDSLDFGVEPDSQSEEPLASDRRPSSEESFERMLYSAAARAGWLTGAGDEHADIDGVTITIRVDPTSPLMKAHDADPLGRGPAQSKATHAELIKRAMTRDELLQRAREIAARHGDPDPELIQHAYGTRYELTRTTGSMVFEDSPSCLLLMKGHFRAQRRRRHRPIGPPIEEEWYSYAYQKVVINLDTGQITDSGGSHKPPDFSLLVEVVTDYDAAG
jgi:hypothetical protein